MPSRKKSHVSFVTKTGRKVSFTKHPKSKSNRPKSDAQVAHLKRAKKAMVLYQTGKASSLADAWKMI